MFVYRNLTRKVWSLKADRKAPVSHAEAVILADVTFKVSEKRRQAVIRQGAREVHAWAIGTDTMIKPIGGQPDRYHSVRCLPWQLITYRPHERGEFFIVSSGEAVTSARFVRFDTDGTAWAII